VALTTHSRPAPRLPALPYCVFMTVYGERLLFLSSLQSRL